MDNPVLSFGLALRRCGITRPSIQERPEDRYLGALKRILGLYERIPATVSYVDLVRRMVFTPFLVFPAHMIIVGALAQTIIERANSPVPRFFGNGASGSDRSGNSSDRSGNSSDRSGDSADMRTTQSDSSSSAQDELHRTIRRRF